MRSLARLDPKTTATQRTARPRWALAVLAAVLAVAVGLVAAGPASAATVSGAQNAVGASTSTGKVGVGPAASISAGQRLGNSPVRPQIVVATGVAAETGAGYVASDVDNVAAHLSTLDHFEANDVMIARIRSALAEGRPLSEGQQNFMLHETREAELMRGGMGYEAAHDEALTVHPPGRNYDPDVIDQFEEFGPWWREMNGLDPR